MSPTELVIIAAVARNGVIGIENRLPWQLPEDMKHFKALTTGHAVIMGRKTWESLPPKFRPLPGRRNIVVTRNAGYDAPGATLAGSLAEAAQAAGGATAFVIGGAEIYTQALELADRLELTEVDAIFDGDAHFPGFDRADWRETARQRHRSETGLDYAFVTYRRTKEK
jgi:dihydrofolate reductase